MRALIVDNLLDIIEEELGVIEGHRVDKAFLELCEIISGREVDLVFIGNDAFEKEDNNYWLPNSCWTEIK